MIGDNAANPACDDLKFRRATWLTFRRTYSSWSHDHGVPGKVVTQLTNSRSLGSGGLQSLDGFQGTSVPTFRWNFQNPLDVMIL